MCHWNLLRHPNMHGKKCINLEETFFISLTMYHRLIFQLKQPGSPCRVASHECDLPEYCTGESEYCPADVHKVDGTSCKVNKSYCFKGTCRTHSDQCKLLWGPTGEQSENQCFEQNKKGTRHGNCGYDRVSGSYNKCNDTDVR